MNTAKGHLLAIVGMSMLVVGNGACSNGMSDDLEHRTTFADNTSADGGTTAEGVIAPSGGSVRAPYEMKTSAEIASAIDGCFGGGVTTVAATMIQTQTNPAGFLASRRFVEGDDVVAGEANVIDGDPSAERTGVRNATLSLSTLASLQDIGNVVGENCAAQLATNPQCNCASRDQAHAMLARCLPSIAPSTYANLEDSFASTCATNPATAIASLLASTAFGVR
jgi:hypothetical protein